MIGNPGNGKTHLAIGLGRRMCSYGFKVGFYTAANLVAELAEAQHDQNLLKLQKSIAKLDLLILDELSYLSFPAAKKNSYSMCFQSVMNGGASSSLRTLSSRVGRKYFWIPC
jgi:DNA replication protein DnaC